MDPELDLPWPTDIEFEFSAKDQAAPTLAEARGAGPAADHGAVRRPLRRAAPHRRESFVGRPASGRRASTGPRYGGGVRGIILAGGTGSRLFPITQAVSKQLMPVYDKPMIYYPLSTLMMAGVREVLVITTPGRPGGVPRPARRRQPARACASSTPSSRGPRAWRRPSSSAPTSSTASPRRWCSATTSSTAPASAPRSAACPRPTAGTSSPTTWPTPQEYGVVEFDADGRVLSIEEKPATPKSSYAVPGLYFYGRRRRRGRPRHHARAPAASSRSPRSTSTTCAQGRLTVTALDRGTAWLDTGTFAVAAPGHRVRVRGRGAPGPQDRLHRGGRLAQRLAGRRRPAPRPPSRWPRAATATTCSACSAAERAAGPQMRR